MDEEQIKDIMYQQEALGGELPPTMVNASGQLDSSFLIQLEHKEFLDDLRHQLKGETFDPTANVYVKTGEPLLNDRGVGYVITAVNCALNKTIILSELTDDDVNDFTKHTMQDILKDVAANHREFGINKLRKSNVLRSILNNTLKSSYKRALFGHTVKLLNTHTRRVETSNASAQREGAASMFAGMFNKKSKFNF